MVEHPPKILASEEKATTTREHLTMPETAEDTLFRWLTDVSHKRSEH